MELVVALATLAFVADRRAHHPVPVGAGRAAVRADGRLPAGQDERGPRPRPGPAVPDPDHRPAGEGGHARAVHRGPEPDDDHPRQRADQRRLPDLLAHRRPAQEHRERRNFAGALQGVATTTLRAVIGDISLDDVLSRRDQINEVLRTKLDESTETLGRQGDPRRDPRDHPAARRPGRDEPPALRRAHAARGDHGVRGRAPVGDQRRRGPEAGRRSSRPRATARRRSCAPRASARRSSASSRPPHHRREDDDAPVPRGAQVRSGPARPRSSSSRPSSPGSPSGSATTWSRGSTAGTGGTPVVREASAARRPGRNGAPEADGAPSVSIAPVECGRGDPGASIGPPGHAYTGLRHRRGPSASLAGRSLVPGDGFGRESPRRRRRRERPATAAVHPQAGGVRRRHRRPTPRTASASGRLDSPTLILLDVKITPDRRLRRRDEDPRRGGPRQPRPDHHAHDRAGRAGEGARAAGRRRRLPDQALPPGGAARPHEEPDRPVRARATRSSGGRRWAASTPTTGRRAASGRRRSRSTPRSRSRASAGGSASSTATSSSATTACSSTSGSTARASSTSSARRRWTPT